MPFGTGAEQVAEAPGTAVPEEAVRRTTEGIGAVAEAEVQALIGQARQGEPIAPLTAPTDPAAPRALVVERDGIQAPLLSGWREVKGSRVAPLGPDMQADPETGRTHLALGPSRYGAGLEPAEDGWWRAHVLACHLGLGTSVALVVLLGDGAEWIWAHARRFLAPGAVNWSRSWTSPMPTRTRGRWATPSSGSAPRRRPGSSRSRTGSMTRAPRRC